MLPRMMINCLVNCQIMSVSVSSLCNSSIFASKASLDSVGYDLLRASRVRISPGCRALVPTGLAIKLRGSIYVKIAPRLCYPLPNFDAIPGIVNPESLCEIKVLVQNNSNEDLCINPGERIAQLIFAKHHNIALQVVRNKSNQPQILRCL